MLFKDFIDNRKSRFKKFKIREEDGVFIASRTYFSFKGLVILSQHFFIINKENPTINDYTKLYELGLKKAKKINRVPLLPGLQFGYMIIPVIVSKNFDEDVINYVQSRPNKHFAIYEFPVAYDLTNNKTDYYKQTAVWGAFFFNDLRNATKELIE